MKVTITPIGSSSKDAAAVAADIVEYLEGAEDEAKPHGRDMSPPATQDAAAVVPYYADSIEGPGQWLGAGAARLGLVGVIAREDFQAVLEGRDPGTGERLLGAQGSSRRGHLAVGRAARRGPAGEALYSIRDVARRLGLTRAETRSLMVADGETRPEQLSALRYDSQLLVTQDELDRYAVQNGIRLTGQATRAEGDDADVLTVTQAAAVLGVSNRYVQRLCRRYVTGSGENDAVQLPCTRTIKGKSERFTIRRTDLDAFADARESPAVRVGYDVTLTCEKSVSLLGSLAVPERRVEVLRAIEAANETMVAYLDRRASFARARGRKIATEGLVIGSYLHRTSRALDPHLHRHNVVANSVVDANKEHRALDGRGLYRHGPAAAALATARLRWELSASGVGFRRRGTSWEVQGISDEAVDALSVGRNELLGVLRELEREIGRPLTHGEEDVAALSTRQAKRAVDAAHLVNGWRERATSAGLTEEAVQRCFSNVASIERFEHLPNHWVRDLHDYLSKSDGMLSSNSSFSRGDVLRAIVDFEHDGKLVVLPPQEVERLADRFLSTDVITELSESTGRTNDVIKTSRGRVVDNRQGEPSFTFVSLLEAQALVVDTYQAGRHSGSGHVSNAVIETQLSLRPELSAEQAALIRSWCSSGHSMQCSIGRAGTGKTYSVRAAAAAWKAAGYRVVGTAIKADAAHLLGQEADIETETLAMWFARVATGDLAFDARTILIVDEATTVSDHDLATLVRMTAEHGTTVRLLGDPAQHGAVQAGGTFAHLTRAFAFETAELSTSRRLLDPRELAAASAVRDGRITTALEQLRANGQLQASPTRRAAYARALNRWLQARHSGSPHPIVVRRNVARRVLNLAAHRLLQETGQVAATGTSICGREFCVGDEVLARVGNRSLYPNGSPGHWLRNGTRAVVTGHTEDCLLLGTPHGTIEVPRHFIETAKGADDIAIDFAYAVTSYAVQGATTNVSTSVIEPGVSRAEAYVNLTRGKLKNVAFAVAVDPIDGEGHLPSLPRALDTELARTLSKPAERTGLECDPDALQVARIKRGRSLASLQAELVRSQRNPSQTARSELLDRAIKERADAVSRCAASDPEVNGFWQQPPSAPWQRATWDQAWGAAAVYRNRWVGCGGRGLTGAPWEWLLGATPSNPEQADERATCVQLLEHAALLAATEHHPDRTDQYVELVRSGRIGRINATRAVGQPTKRSLPGLS